jgi:hypothetical protein
MPSGPPPARAMLAPIVTSNVPLPSPVSVALYQMLEL